MATAEALCVMLEVRAQRTTKTKTKKDCGLVLMSHKEDNTGGPPFK